jgi:Na+/H+ antiporter NhaD/arsenite permease-like protein
VIRLGGWVGRRLFFYLYASFFGLGIFIGNDPIMVLFLSYMTRVTRNILDPRAWIYTQFAAANIAAAILVSSNPTNLVLAGAFNIKFISYTANIIIPVISTAMSLFPFLLYCYTSSLLTKSSSRSRLRPTSSTRKQKIICL